MDLLSEMYDNVSPYNYVFNNPMSYIDLFGMGPDDCKDCLPGGQKPEVVIPVTGPDPVPLPFPKWDPYSQPSEAEKAAQEAAAAAYAMQQWAIKMGFQNAVPKYDPNKLNHGGGAGKVLATTLVATVSAGEVPPVAAGILILGLGYTTYKAFTSGPGNANYPGPWGYTYQHPSQNPINNPPQGFDPENPPPGWGGAIKWMIRAGFGYEIYDEYQQRMNEQQPYIVPKDNTNVVQPQFIPYRPR